MVKEGTGRRVRALGRPVAGKTGTTNNLFDAWFVGYTPRFNTGVWVGFDEGGSLGKGETGSRAASPIWLGFMKQILDGEPVKVFQAPEGVVFAKIDAETGLLTIPESKKVIFECFKEGTVPTQHTKKPEKISENEDFLLKATPSHSGIGILYSRQSDLINRVENTGGKNGAFEVTSNTTN